MNSKENRSSVFMLEVVINLILTFIVNYIIYKKNGLTQDNIGIYIILSIVLILLFLLITCTIHTKYYIGSKDFNVLRMYTNNKMLSYNENLKEYNKYTREFNKIKKGNNYKNVSLSVIKRAESNVIRYMCKYFDIVAEEETVEHLENYVHIVSNLEGYSHKLNKLNEDIANEINTSIPIIILMLNKGEIYHELKYEEIKINFNPDSYKLKYTSEAGRSTRNVEFVLNSYNAKKLLSYIDNIVETESFSKRQRKLMTNNLREKIKARDNYTCKLCGKSQLHDRNIVLEIDHIIPVSKGGKTIESNLQTLCMQCNRKKSNKL